VSFLSVHIIDVSVVQWNCPPTAGLKNAVHMLCTADSWVSHTPRKFQRVACAEVIPESPSAAEVPPAADSPQPGPSGLAAPPLGSSSSSSSHPPPRFVL